MAEPQRKFPLSAKLQMEDLPTEMLAGNAVLTQSAAKEKGFWWGCSGPSSLEKTRLRWWQMASKDTCWWKGPIADPGMKRLGGGSDRELVQAGFLHIDFECNMTTH